MAGVRVLLFSETPELIAELASAAQSISRHVKLSVDALVCGSKLEGTLERLVELPVERILVVEHEVFAQYPGSLDPYVDALHEVARGRHDLVLVSSTKRGREIAARVAARLDVTCATDCTKLDWHDGALAVERVVYGGKCVARELLTLPAVVALAPGKYPPAERTGKRAEVVKVSLALHEPRVKVLESKPKAVAGPRLEEAEIIVGCGRGFRRKEDLKLAEELAKVLGGVVGCSRPLSADYGWFPQWIGLSGVKVRPKLYIAVGISGAIQHMAGVTDAKIVVAINKDENAPIFEQCDYGIVGDLYEVLPKLIEALKRLKS